MIFKIRGKVIINFSHIINKLAYILKLVKCFVKVKLTLNIAKSFNFNKNIKY